jgi:hypothetical protein
MSRRAGRSSAAWGLASLAALMMSAACARDPDSTSTTVGAQQLATPTAMADTTPAMVVHKTPSCGCCGLWVEHMRQAGFTVEVRDTDDLAPIKAGLGVPYGKGSCHTAEIDGYVIEGHVPAEDVRRLLTERPKARGLVLPGMPLGSPGMEMPDGRVQSYTVELVKEDGSTSTFRRVEGDR